MSDGKGLFLVVAPSGTRSWTFRYIREGKERRLSLGRYPGVGLKAARMAREKARALLGQGVDPVLERNAQRQRSIEDTRDSFEAVARAWHAARSPRLTPRYAEQILARLENNTFRALGHKPVRDITPADVLQVIRAIENRGALEMAKCIRAHMSEVFVWAIAESLTDTDPADVIRKAMRPVITSPRPAVLALERARYVRGVIDAARGTWWATRLASRLLALTAARPGVVRLAEASEFEGLDTAEPIWRIPASKMKQSAQSKRDSSNNFIIPLSLAAAALARAAIDLSPSHLLFPGAGGWKKPISDSTLSQIYLDLGLRGIMVPHGWRATFSTIMNERAALAGRDGDRAVIDLMLAHRSSSVESLYNRAAFMPRRRELAQEWSDLLLEGAAPLETLLPR